LPKIGIAPKAVAEATMQATPARRTAGAGGRMTDKVGGSEIQRGRGERAEGMRYAGCFHKARRRSGV